MGCGRKQVYLSLKGAIEMADNLKNLFGTVTSKGKMAESQPSAAKEMTTGMAQSAFQKIKPAIQSAIQEAKPEKGIIQKPDPIDEFKKKLAPQPRPSINLPEGIEIPENPVIVPSAKPIPDTPNLPDNPTTMRTEGVPFEEVKGEITRGAVLDGMARDALNSVGHEMNADAFQDYVREMTVYEAWVASREVAVREGFSVTMEIMPKPEAPEGCQGIYDQAYEDYKLRKEALDSYLNPDSVNATGNPDNPYKTEEGMKDIADRYQATEKTVTEIAACSGGQLPVHSLGGDSLVERMSRRAEWGDAYDAIERYCNPQEKNIWKTDDPVRKELIDRPVMHAVMPKTNRIDCTGVGISETRRAEIESLCPSERSQGITWPTFEPGPEPPTVIIEPPVGDPMMIQNRRNRELAAKRLLSGIEGLDDNTNALSKDKTSGLDLGDNL